MKNPWPATIPWKVKQAMDMLAQGESQRAVSRVTGISRCTVDKIAHGKWVGGR